jgi:hypothetical protein
VHYLIDDQFSHPKQDHRAEGFDDPRQDVSCKQAGASLINFLKKPGDGTPAFEGFLQGNSLLIGYGSESAPHNCFYCKLQNSFHSTPSPPCPLNI